MNVKQKSSPQGVRHSRSFVLNTSTGPGSPPLPPSAFLREGKESRADRDSAWELDGDESHYAPIVASTLESRKLL